MSWYNSTWHYRIEITVSHTNIDSNLTDHPLLIAETNMPDEFWNHVKSDGSDIVLTSSDGITKLKRELVSIDTSGKTMELWVKTDLSSSVDTIIYLYYGKPAASESNDADTWDSNFAAVLHLEEDSGTLQDSTIHGSDGTQEGAFTYGVNGKIGKAVDFNGAGNISLDTAPSAEEHTGIGEGASTQGITTDGTYFWITDDTHLTKLNAAWAQLDFVVIPAKAGDCCYYDGKIYIPTSNHPTTPVVNKMRIYNADTLVFIEEIELSDITASWTSGVAWDGEYFWISTYGANPDSAYKYNTSFVYQNESHSLGQNEVQGIEFYDDHLYASLGGKIYCYIDWVYKWHYWTLCYQGLAIFNDILYMVHNHDEKVWEFNFWRIAHWEKGTIEVWYKPDDPWYNYNSIWNNEIDSNSWEAYIYSDGRLGARLKFDGALAIYDLDGLDGPGYWYHIALTWELDGNKILYVNGVSRATQAVTYNAPEQFYLAGGHGNTYGKGVMDEVRISSIERSAAYLKANYYNVTDTSNFYGMSSEKSYLSYLLISDDWVLLYYDTDHWVDISEYVIEITSLKYDIDNRIQGAGTVLNVVLNDAATYGTGKYALGIGDDYFLYGAPGDGIEEIADCFVSITLFDYLFLNLFNKSPLYVNGQGAVEYLGGGAITVKSFLDFEIPYRTDRDNPSFEGFVKQADDAEHYMDKWGNVIELDSSEMFRFDSPGMISVEDGSVKLGEKFVSINDIFNNIVTAEDFTLTIDSPSDNDNDFSLPEGTKKVWHAMLMGDHLLTLRSEVGKIILESWTTPSSGGNELIDFEEWESRDWDADSNGVDYFGYLILPDYHNRVVYIPFWYCSDYNGAASDNSYDLYVAKISLDVDGNLTKDYEVDVTDFNQTIVRAWRGGDANDRLLRSAGTHPRFLGFYIYANGDVTYFNVDYVQSGHWHVYDLDLLEASSPDNHCDYNLPWGSVSYSDSILDHINGTAHCFYTSGAVADTVHEILKINMAELTAGEKSAETAPRPVVDELNFDADNFIIGKWRESLVYKKDITTEHAYRVPQLPNGLMTKEGVWNNYLRSNDDYFSVVLAIDVAYAGTAWDLVNDYALHWKTNADLDPATFYWNIRKNYAMKHIFMYQPAVYLHRKEQFLDTLISFGYFYEQKNGVIRLFPLSEAGASLGTITDDDWLYKQIFDGFSNFVDKFSIKILGKKSEYGNGTRHRTLKSLYANYGWNSPLQIKYYSGWINKINGSQDGIELHLFMDAFHDIASTYMPDLGKTFTHDSTEYILIENKIELKNWITRLKGIKNV